MLFGLGRSDVDFRAYIGYWLLANGYWPLTIDDCARNSNSTLLNGAGKEEEDHLLSLATTDYLLKRTQQTAAAGARYIS
eukprot:scaffold787_cov285-Chaetoceros_neogracile.AAC.27